jgi:hypothetical protein
MFIIHMKNEYVHTLGLALYRFINLIQNNINSNLINVNKMDSCAN